MLLSAMGVERERIIGEDGRESEQWRIPYGNGCEAVMDVWEPKTVTTALTRHHDLGLFYGYTGDKHGSRWRPNAATTLPEGVATGHREADGLIAVVMALSERSRQLRRVGRTAAQVTAPFRDWRARREWTESTERTKGEIAEHYDTDQRIFVGYRDNNGNEFEGMLDPRLTQYSSGLFLPEHAGTTGDALLQELQEAKVDALIEKLGLKPGMRILEVGGGWGGLAIAIAKRNPDVKIVSLTVSDEQLKIAQERAQAEGLTGQVQFVGEDYRDHTSEEPYDRVISVEMIEAVDWRDYGTYFGELDRFVKPDGRVVLQAITVRKEQEASQHNRRSFANTAIFPGGCLPSVATIDQHMTERGFARLAMEPSELGASYALTIQQWLRRFNDNLPQLRSLWEQEGRTSEQIDRFTRGFNFYLAACIAGFRPETGPNISAQQLVFERAA
ncbi:hypothetical protein CSA80_02495 [Candidatus Saccharibacteria bacterium]|nr:MAG: hypothetical protein CSA80_02495 [Candidatus Saccharibacteria bacterium]